MLKHYVKFFIPMNFGSSQATTYNIKKWDIDKAKQMSLNFIDSHGVFPITFQFFTQNTEDKTSQDGIIDSSCTYFINVVIKTYEDVKAENGDKPESNLMWNMRVNKINKIAARGDWAEEFRECDELIDIEIVNKD